METSVNFDEFVRTDTGEISNLQLDKDNGTAIQRKESSYVNHDGRFKIQKRDYERQFAQLYFSRLVKLRPHVVKAATAAWPNVPCVRVLDVPEDKEVCIVGTLYKEMSLKPSILDEYTKDVGAQLGGNRFTQAGDVLVLEDEGGRVSLVGDALDVGTMVTGVIVAVKGTVSEEGDFRVVDVCYAGHAPQQSRAISSSADDGQDKSPAYVALMSGFSFGMDSETDMLKVEMMLDYCAGILGSEPEQKQASNIVRVVFAGGILKGSSSLSQPTSYASVREQATALEPIQEADALLANLCETVDVDVMPGVTDPVNYSLPQQPLHRCLLPRACSVSSLVRCTNPHAFEIDGVQFLGTSGQNVDDVMRYSTYESPTDILQNMLSWRHIIPTAPDSLATYPYSDEDPFILEETPHVLFAGGQTAYGTTKVQGPDGQVTRVVSVPEFSRQPMMVLVNIHTLDVHPVYFDTSLE
ncbi:hypothetical protein M9434_006933 [Picochlorum sp. BPE23]|nr:hypothetical protein M9434_006933 [Picochlorum sp. BPE23]